MNCITKRTLHIHITDYSYRDMKPMYFFLTIIDSERDWVRDEQRQGGKRRDVEWNPWKKDWYLKK